MLSYRTLPYHSLGGMERHIYYLTKYLIKNNITVHLFTAPPFNQESSIKYEKSSKNLIVHFVNYFHIPLQESKGQIILNRIINYPIFSLKLGSEICSSILKGKVNFDIVHSHGLSSFGYGVQKKLYKKILPPMIMNPHGMEEFKTKNIFKKFAYCYFKAMQRYGAYSSEKVIATDYSIKDEVKHYLKIPEEKITIIPNGIDVDECLRFVNDDTKKNIINLYSLSKKSIIFISVGRLDKSKGYDVLIDALNKIRNNLPDNWLWILVGDGTMKKDLLNKIRMYELEKNVLLTGKISDVELHNFYDIADIFIHPTLYEGSSIVTLEAMVHGKPIIASNTGGIPDKVIDNKNGFLTKVGDANDIANKILLIINNKEKWSDFGKESQMIVKNNFSMEKIVSLTIEEYEKMLGEK